MDQRIPLRLAVSNHCSEPAYLSPVIGEIAGQLEAYVRPLAKPAEVYTIADVRVYYSGCAEEDLFKLMPRRRLERLWVIDVRPHLPRGEYELWVEFDAREMAQGGDKAFAGVLVSACQRMIVRP